MAKKDKREYTTSRNERLYSLHNKLHFSLVVFMLIVGFLGIYTKNKILNALLVFSLLLSGLLSIISHLYFRKADMLRGVSRYSKLQIFGTIMWSVLCFIFAYSLAKLYFLIKRPQKTFTAHNFTIPQPFYTKTFPKWNKRHNGILQ